MSLICTIGNGIKPVVCANEHCIWRHQELGLGVKLTRELSIDEVRDMDIKQNNVSTKPWVDWTGCGGLIAFYVPGHVFELTQ